MKCELCGRQIQFGRFCFQCKQKFWEQIERLPEEVQQFASDIFEANNPEDLIPILLQTVKIEKVSEDTLDEGVCLDEEYIFTLKDGRKLHVIVCTRACGEFWFEIFP